MQDVFLTGSGLYTPAESISNEELVVAFNTYVERFNQRHAADIENGAMEPLQPSDPDFITKASGIKSRYVVDKKGIIDPEVMCPRIRTRSNDEASLMCEMALAACQQALQKAGRSVADVDGVVVACSNMPRAYPALAVEIQHYLGIDGFAFDLNVACASATFGMQSAADMIRSGNARRLLVVNPEICTAHLNFRDRDSHFIFGDACTAVLLEGGSGLQSDDVWKLLATRLKTQFSSNIRNNFGFLNRCEQEEPRSDADILFVQEGRKVFKEVVPMVSTLIQEHLEAIGLSPEGVKRMWLHQANLNMNQLIAKRVLGREATLEEAPVVLDDYANTSSAGSVIAFHQYHRDMQSGDVGVLCAFGAGYSAGSAILQRM